MSEETNKLTAKQKKFCDEYLLCLNAKQAAIRAGYSEHTAGEMGYENLNKPHLRDYLNQQMKLSAMPPEEVIQRLTSMASGDLGDYLKVYDNGLAMFDLKRAQEEGKMHLVKKIKIGKRGLEIELHDSQRALETLAKYHGLLQTNINVNWRQELEDTGQDASELFAQLIAAIASAQPES